MKEIEKQLDKLIKLIEAREKIYNSDDIFSDEWINQLDKAHKVISEQRAVLLNLMKNKIEEFW